MEKRAGFLHIDAYALKAYGTKPSVGGVIDEFMREPSACHHVQNPMAPKVHFLADKPISGILPLLDDLRAQAFDLTGQRVRINAPLMMAGVVSHPATIEEMRESREIYELTRDWVNRNGVWIRRRWPGVYMIGEHQDEEHPHLHFFKVAELDENGLSLGNAHPGRFAGKNAKQKAIDAGIDRNAPEAKWAYNVAYKAAMVELLDDYAKAMEPCGLTRRSAKPRKRDARADYLAKQKVEAELAELERVKGYFKAQGLDWNDLRILCADYAHTMQEPSAYYAPKPHI